MEIAAAGSAAGVPDGVREELEHEPSPANQAAALEMLRWDWGEAYEIGIDDETGAPWYERRDGLGIRGTAHDLEELHKLIVEDYTFHPVRREDVR